MGLRQLLDQKGRILCCISPNTSVFDAIAKMAGQDIGSLFVMVSDKLFGIITERHYARNVALKGKTSPKIPVREIMERHVIVALPENSVESTFSIVNADEFRNQGMRRVLFFSVRLSIHRGRIGRRNFDLMSPLVDCRPPGMFAVMADLRTQADAPRMSRKSR